MSSLRERLLAGELQRTVLTIRGERYLVQEIEKGERIDLLATCRDAKGVMNTRMVENLFLSRCVLDDSTSGEIFGADESHLWDGLGAGITAPLLAEIFRLNGLDDDDVGREVKKSETAESSE